MIMQQYNSHLAKPNTTGNSDNLKNTLTKSKFHMMSDNESTF